MNYYTEDFDDQHDASEIPSAENAWHIAADKVPRNTSIVITSPQNCYYIRQAH